MPSRNLIREVIKSLVLLQSAAEGDPGLHARVCGILYRAERIHRLKVSISQISIYIAVKLVRPRARDDVDHPTRSASVLGGVVIPEHLDLAHRVLIDRHADLVVAARLRRIQSVNRCDRGAPALTRNVRQVRAEALAHGLYVVVVRGSRYQSKQRSDVAPLSRDEADLV